MVTTPSSVQPLQHSFHRPKVRHRRGSTMLALLRLVVAVGLWGGLDGFLLGVTLGEDEPVDVGERRSGAVCARILPRPINDASATHRAPTTYGFVGARYPLAYSSGSRYGLDALAEAPLVSHPPGATRPKAIAYERPRRCCRWAA